jgi:hypothetical protein
MQRSRRRSSTRFGASWRPWSLRSKNMASRSPHPSSVCPRIGAALGPTDTSRSSSSSACSCARACDGPTGRRSMTRRPWVRRPDQRARMEPLARRLERGVGDGGARGDSRPETRPYAAGDHRSFARARAVRQIISVTGLRQSDVSRRVSSSPVAPRPWTSRRLRRVAAARSICSSRRRRTDRRSKAQPQYFPPAGPHDRSCRMDGRSCWDLHPSGGPLRVSPVARASGRPR